MSVAFILPTGGLARNFCHFDRSGEYGVRGRRRMDCGSGSRLGRSDENGRAFRENASQISYASLLLVALSLANRSLGNAGEVRTISAVTDRRYRIVLPSAVQGPSYLSVGRWALSFCPPSTLFASARLARSTSKTRAACPIVRLPRSAVCCEKENRAAYSCAAPGGL